MKQVELDMVYFKIHNTMDEVTKREYQEYLDYMYKYEEENGYYPMHLSNTLWTPYSESEYLDKTKNGKKRLNY